MKYLEYRYSYNEVTAIIFIKISNDGPTVSFRGSPTVSPTTAALWASVPLASPSISPASILLHYPKRHQNLQ